jgi:hypothetical protein
LQATISTFAWSSKENYVKLLVNIGDVAAETRLALREEEEEESLERTFWVLHEDYYNRAQMGSKTIFLHLKVIF